MPRTCSKAHRLRQKPSLGFTRLRRDWQCFRARAAFQPKRRMRRNDESQEGALTLIGKPGFLNVVIGGIENVFPLEDLGSPHIKQ
ncbi:MAG: hypothetical protein FRX49_08811 [Trebouxia sp. A1-2]|nr:MAG: hypothetical protein FRX49_08811 [Trebouxia sp. A1-2]